MFAAVNDADAPRLKQTFWISSPQAGELAGAYADLIVAARHLRDTAQTKFAGSTPNVGPVHDGTTPGVAPPEQAAQLAAADVSVSGDRATVTIPDRPTPVHLQRTNGNWQIDLADFAAGTPQQLSEQADVDRGLATAMQETSDEITAGKYASAQEAEAAVQQKIHAAIVKQTKATTVPTTKPS